MPIQPNKTLIVITASVLAVVSGLRSNIGDTFNYVRMYEEKAFTWNSILEEKDIGFGVLQMFLKSYVSEDPQIMIFVTAVITNVLIVMVLYNYSRMIEVSLYVYITGGLFLVSMNGIRQVLAAAIVFSATKYLFNADWKKYFAIVILASFFHQSALIMLPVYFLVRVKAWSKATIAIILFSIIAVIGFEQFNSLLFSAIEGTQYGDYRDFDEGGASFTRVLVTAVPLFIAYLGREKLKEIMPKNDYIINMTLLGLVFMVIATQSWIFARVSIYFSFYQLILISWIIKIFRERDQKIIYFAIFVCYLGYYYYENVITLDILYKSKFLIW